MLQRPESDVEDRSLAWERRGLFPLLGLVATMIGVFRPERRAEALYHGPVRPALAFALASFVPVTAGAFWIAHQSGAVAGPVSPFLAAGVIASFAGAVALVGSFASMARAEGACPREAARAALFLVWLVPLFLIDFGGVAVHAFGYSPERAEVFGAMAALLPLLLSLVGLEAAAKHGAGIAPRTALLSGVVPAVLAFAVGRVALAAAGF